MELDVPSGIHIRSDEDSEVSKSDEQLAQRGSVICVVGPVAVPAADVDDSKSIQTSGDVDQSSSCQSIACLKLKRFQLTATINDTQDTVVGDSAATGQVERL